MPWLDVTEPFAKPPKLRPVRPSQSWSGPLEPETGWAVFDDVTVGRDQVPDRHMASGMESDPASGLASELAHCSELTVTGSVLHGVTGFAAGTLLEARAAELRNCDLSRLSIRSLRATRVVGCKLTGVDMSGATLHDVEFTGCVLRHISLRMARMRRVRFIDCTIDDADCFELQAEDVDLPGTTLESVSVDRLKAERFDLRSAASVGLTNIGSLRGCLAAQEQIPALAYPLAFALDLTIERDEADAAP